MGQRESRGYKRLWEVMIGTVCGSGPGFRGYSAQATGATGIGDDVCDSRI